MTASMKAIVNGRSTSRPRDRTAVAKTSAAIGNAVQTKAKPSVVSGLAAAAVLLRLFVHGVQLR